MSKPSSLDEILGHDEGCATNVTNDYLMCECACRHEKQQIRELAQSVLLEYKDKHLGREGIKILNELHERMGRL